MPATGCGLCALGGSSLRRSSTVDSHCLAPPLTRAILQDRLQHVQHWIEHVGCDINAIDNTGTTPLQRAVLGGNLHIVEYLLLQGAHVNAKAADDQDTALHIAAAHGFLAIVERLLVHGADVEARNAVGIVPLLIATQNNHIEVVQALTLHGASTSALWPSRNGDRFPCLHLAVQHGHVQLTKYFLSVVAMDLNLKTPGKSLTPLHVAAQYGQIEILDLLLAQRANVHATDDQGMTPLHHASEYQYDHNVPCSQHGQIERVQCEIVDHLIAAGANVKARRKWDQATPLRCAAKQRHFMVAKTLLGHGARSNRASLWLFALVWGRDPYKVKYLVSAAKLSRQSSQEYTTRGSAISCSKSNVRPTVADAECRNELDGTMTLDTQRKTTTQVSSPKSLASVQTNSRRRASTSSQPRRSSKLRPRSPSQNESFSYTSLHLACSQQRLTHMNELIALGADIHARMPGDGLTPLHIVARNGFMRGTQCLLTQGADIEMASTSEGKTALHFAAENGHIPVIGTLVDAGADVEAVDLEGTTAVLLALRNGQSNAMKYLLRHGAYAPLDTQSNAVLQIFDRNKTTALHIAAFYGQLEKIKDLTWNGADVDATDDDGATPVWIAALLGHLDVVDYLGQQGANLNTVAKHGGSASLGAAEFGHLEVLEYLSTSAPDQVSYSRLSV